MSLSEIIPTIDTSRQILPGPFRVKLGKAQREHMFSAFLPTTDIAQRSRHVGFVPPIAAVGQPLLYHLVGALLDGQRHVDAKGLGGLEVHHEFKLDWLFDR
jgi:hypothetical protein